MKVHTSLLIFVLPSLLIGCGDSNNLSNDVSSSEQLAKSKLDFSESERIDKLKTAERLFSFSEKYATENDINNLLKAANKLLKLHSSSDEANLIKELAVVSTLKTADIYDINEALKKDSLTLNEVSSICGTFKSFRSVVVGLRKATLPNVAESAKDLMQIDVDSPINFRECLKAAKHMKESALIADQVKFGMTSYDFFKNYGDEFINKAPYSKSFSRNQYFRPIIKETDGKKKLEYRIENNIIFKINRKTKKRVGYISDSVPHSDSFKLTNMPLNQKMTIAVNDLYDLDKNYVGYILNAESEVTRNWYEAKMYNTNKVSVGYLRFYNEVYSDNKNQFNDYLVINGDFPFEK